VAGLIIKLKLWLGAETGFQVFEGTALMLGGVSLALFIGTAAIAISGYEYTRVENEFIGSAVEADDSIQRFR
jgi:hypothetical protein